MHPFYLLIYYIFLQYGTYNSSHSTKIMYYLWLMLGFYMETESSLSQDLKVCTSQLCFSIINADYLYNNLKKHKMTLKKHMYTMAFEGISVTQRNCNIVVTWSFSERHFSTLTDCGGTNVKHPISEKKHHTSTTLKPPVRFGLYLILGKTSSVWVIAG